MVVQATLELLQHLGQDNPKHHALGELLAALAAACAQASTASMPTWPLLVHPTWTPKDCAPT
jgi:hypothetical protein